MATIHTYTYIYTHLGWREKENNCWKWDWGWALTHHLRPCREMRFFLVFAWVMKLPSLEGYSSEQQSLYMSETHVKMFTVNWSGWSKQLAFVCPGFVRQSLIMRVGSGSWLLVRREHRVGQLSRFVNTSALVRVPLAVMDHPVVDAPRLFGCCHWIPCCECFISSPFGGLKFSLPPVANRSHFLSRCSVLLSFLPISSGANTVCVRYSILPAIACALAWLKCCIAQKPNPGGETKPRGGLTGRVHVWVWNVKNPFAFSHWLACCAITFEADIGHMCCLAIPCQRYRILTKKLV